MTLIRLMGDTGYASDLLGEGTIYGPVHLVREDITAVVDLSGVKSTYANSRVCLKSGVSFNVKETAETVLEGLP